MPGLLVGCQTCQYRMKSQEEAAELLRTVIRQAHIRSIRGGGMLMEARLDKDVLLKLCVWDSACEDCEVGEDFGDGTEVLLGDDGPDLDAPDAEHICPNS